MIELGSREDAIGRARRVQRVVHARDLLLLLVERDLKLRYNRSVLGVAWALLNPLAYLLVLYFVFRRVVPLDVPHFTTFLFTGLLAWNWFQGALSASTGAVVNNADLLRQPGFPAAILPASIVTAHLVHFLFALPVLFAFALADGICVRGTAALLPLVVALQFAFTLGLAFAAAAAHVRFRDTQYLLGVALHVLFFATPIFYPASAVPPGFRFLLAVNPAALVIVAYRSTLVDGVAPDAAAALGTVAYALVVLGAGYWVFSRASARFLEEM